MTPQDHDTPQSPAPVAQDSQRVSRPTEAIRPTTPLRRRLTLREPSNQPEISPPKPPILLFLLGAGKLATTRAKVRTVIDGNNSSPAYEVASPVDPEVLSSTGPGTLALKQVNRRFPLDDESEDEIPWTDSDSDEQEPLATDDPEGPVTPDRYSCFGSNVLPASDEGQSKGKQTLRKIIRRVMSIRRAGKQGEKDAQAYAANLRSYSAPGELTR